MYATRLLTIAAVMAAAACSHDSPPTYKLTGDACAVVPEKDLEPLAGAAPESTPNTLKDGLSGGACTLKFDGDAGFFQLDTFVAINASEKAATDMFDEFHTSDGAAADATTAVFDVKDLGTAAFARRQYLADGGYQPGSNYLYKLTVRDGTLVLTVLYSGFARVPASWPASEKAFQQKIDDVAEKMMKTMST
jgi:hypothetical protein